MNCYLSVIITSHNDFDETQKTVCSLKSTLKPEDNVEIILIDDCSATPLHCLPFEYLNGIRLITNRWRCGCGPSRHIGALHAEGDYLLFLDSHMRFPNGWYQEWLVATYRPGQNVIWDERTVFCATCLGLDSKHMDPEHPATIHHGATMNFLGPDRFHPEKEQVFESVWLPKKPEPQDGQELGACMGACYFVSRNWFLHLSPTRYLRTWGGDEQMLSLKSWLAGGSVRLAKNVRIAHKFLIEGKEKQPWAAPVGHVTWSKLFAINTLLPEDMAAKLTEKLLAQTNPLDADWARRALKADWFLVATERALNRTLFTRDIEWFAKKFNIPLP